MTEYADIFFAVGYAVIAVTAIVIVDKHARYATQQLRKAYEDSLAVLNVRLCDLYVENQDLRDEVGQLRRMAQSDDLSIYEEVDM